MAETAYYVHYGAPDQSVSSDLKQEILKILRDLNPTMQFNDHNQTLGFSLPGNMIDDTVRAAFPQNVWYVNPYSKNNKLRVQISRIQMPTSTQTPRAAVQFTEMGGAGGGGAANQYGGGYTTMSAKKRHQKARKEGLMPAAFSKPAAASTASLSSSATVSTTPPLEGGAMLPASRKTRRGGGAGKVNNARKARSRDGSDD